MNRSSKLGIITLIIGFCVLLANITSHAQSFFSTTPKPTPQTNTVTTGIPPSRVIPPDEFNKIATQVNQQNASTLEKEAQQNVPKLTPPLPPPVIPNSAASSAPDTTPVAPNPTTMPTTAAPNPPTITVAPNNNPPAVSNVVTTPPPPMLPASSPPAVNAPVNNQPYTGFGVSNTPNEKPASDTTSGKPENTGWRIHY